MNADRDTTKTENDESSVGKWFTDRCLRCGVLR